MPKHIGLPTAKRLVKAAIKIKGDNYTPPETCTYFAGARPSCIVGVALSTEGLTADQLISLGEVDTGVKTWEGKISPLAANSCKIRDLAPHLAPFGFTFSKAAVMYLNNVQALQDTGNNWTEAQTRVDRMVDTDSL